MVCDWCMYWNLKYLGCILDKAEGCREVASGRRVGGAIRSLVNVRDLQGYHRGVAPVYQVRGYVMSYICALVSASCMCASRYVSA